MNTEQKTISGSLLLRAFVGLILGMVLLLPFAPAASAQECIGAPRRPRLEYPQNGSTVAMRQVPMNWKAVRCATTYSVEIRQGDNFGRPLDGAYNLTQARYNTRRLPKGHRYWWIVKACNGNQCVNSRWGSFTIEK